LWQTDRIPTVVLPKPNHFRIAIQFPSTHLTSMPLSISHVVIHTIFSTKHRHPFFKDTELRERTFGYLGGVSKTLDCLPIQIGGYVDHVHLLTTLPRTLAIADAVKEIKRVGSGWVKENADITNFAWQTGCGVFSVSESQVSKVKSYIQGQEEHHRTRTFQEEYRTFLDRHQIPYDERYVWD
jgi:REP element-mobilizing transposase RayT